MLECTWNDVEAQIALRFMMLKEREKTETLANDAQLREKTREAALARLAMERTTAESPPADTL
jgi:hypothetical protein